MAGEKKKPSVDFTLSRKFVRNLANQLVSDCERGFFLASSTQDLEDSLQKSADSLPGGKLRSTLLSILQRQNKKNDFVAALQNEIRVLSAKLELHGDVLLTPLASDRLFEALVTCIRGDGASSFTSVSIKEGFSHEDIQRVLFQDPAPHVLWALAAVKLFPIDGATVESLENGAHCNTADNVNFLASSFSSSALTLLRCLKPWVVGRNASIALATLAPVVPLLMESLKQSINKTLRNIKDLRIIVKEVLSLIVALNYKEQFIQDSCETGSRQTPLFPYLFDGFWAVYKSLGLDGIITQMEGLSTTEKLKLMFPLAPVPIEKAIKPPDVRVGVVADIVKVEFLLLQVVLDVIYCKKKPTMGHSLVGNGIGIFREQGGSMAVSGVTASQQDLLLDALLPDSVLGDLLDDGDRSLVRFSVLNALLAAGSVFCKTSLDEASGRNKKALELFLKRITVARKINVSQRLPYDILETLRAYFKAPHKLFDFLKSCTLIRKLPDERLQNDKALIGFLLHVDDAAFQAVAEMTSINYREADAEVEEDLCTKSSVDCLLRRDTRNQSDSEVLFFVDTTGEEKSQGDDNTPSTHRKSRKRKKGKEKQVLFHREGHVDTTGEEKSQGDDNTPSTHRKSRKRKKGKEKQVLFHREGLVKQKMEAEYVSEGSSDSSLDTTT